MTTATQKETINYYFNPDEVSDLSKKIAEMIGQASEKESEKKAITKQYNADLEALSAEIKKLAGLIHDGFERREMECPIEPDYEAKTVDILHPQTGQLVRRRQMFDSEQRNLPFGPDPAKAAEARRQKELEEWEKAFAEYEPEPPPAKAKIKKKGRRK